MVNAIVVVVAGVAALAAVVSADKITASKITVGVNCPSTKPNTLFLVSVYGYVINPRPDERLDILTTGAAGFKQTDKDKAEKALAGGCKDVRVELWEEDDFADEQACGEDETTTPKKTPGPEFIVTGANGFFHLAGISQDCGPDVEPFIKIIFNKAGTNMPISCGEVGKDKGIDSEDASFGRIRLAIPDKPYGQNNVDDDKAGKEYVDAMKELTELSKVDDVALKIPKKGFYLGRVNLQLVEYFHETHDFEDGELNMEHLSTRVEKICDNDGQTLKGWKVSGKSALFWMKDALTAAYGKAKDKTKKLPEAVSKTDLKSLEPKHT